MKLVTFFSSVLVIASLSHATAETHTIVFGGAVGNTYSPSSLTVSVGDVIIFSGDFSFHPLSSDAIPGGANAFSASSGSSFSYTVTVAGNYAYHCTVHGGPGVGMSGQFTAVAASVAPARLSRVELLQNYPNPAIPLEL
jgi:plastocyanin